MVSEAIMFHVTAYQMFKMISSMAKSCFFEVGTRHFLGYFRSEAPPSKYMRLGSGISNIAKSPIVSCFDVELFAEEDLSDQDGMSESDLLALFGCTSHAHCSV